MATIASSMDLMEAFDERGMPYDDDSPAQSPLRTWDSNKILMVCSTSLYLIDAILHVLESHRGDEADTEDFALLVLHSARLRFAIGFGVAAFFDLASSSTEDEDYPWPSYVFSCGSAFLFWTCAAILLYTKRSSYCGYCYPLPKSCGLLCLGDWCFMAGCTVDVVACFFDTPLHDVSYIWSASRGMLSSLCWQLDALLYQWANADLFDVAVPADSTSPTLGPSLISIPQEDTEDHLGSH